MRIASSIEVSFFTKRLRSLQVRAATSSATARTSAPASPLTTIATPFLGVSLNTKPPTMETSSTPLPSLVWP